MKDHADLCSMSWIEKWPTHQWGGWLHQDAGVPRLDDRELLHDLGVDEDHLQQVEDFIERPTITNMAAVTSHCSSASRCLPSVIPGRVHAYGDAGEHEGAQGADARRVLGGSVGSDGGDGAGGNADAQGARGARAGGHHTQPQIPLSGSWLSQLNELILRKHSYGLGFKSALSVMAFALSFVINLKRRVAERRAGAEKQPPMSNRWLGPQRWPRSLVPWCNTMLCGLSPAAGCGRPHPRLGHPSRLGGIPDPEGGPHPSEPPKKHDSHFLLQKRSVVGYNLGCPEALAEAEQLMRASSDHTKDDISFSELRVLAFDYLCYVNSGQFCVRGFEVTSQACLWGSRLIALGRKQRDWALGEDTVPRLRCIDNNTPFAHLCVHSAHAVSMGESTGLSKLYLASLRIVVEGEARLLKLAQQDCHSCNLSRAYHQRSDTKMRSHHLGPSGHLTALGSYPPGLACSQIDLVGPLTYLDQMANSVKLYLLICVSNTWGATRLVPIKSKSTESVLLGLKTLALQQSTRFELVGHDDGGEFYHTSTTFSPMEESSGEPLVKKWFSTFEKEADQIELEGLGIWVKFGKSRQCSAAERRVADVKRVFKNFHLFQQDSEKTDLYEILFLCALVEHVIGSRPILVHGDRVYSLNTLRSLMMNTGSLTSEADGVEPIDTGVRRQAKVEKLCTRLSDLRVQMTRLIMSFHLDTLLDNVHRRERVKHGKAVETLAHGDIVFDSVGFEKSGHLTGSLAKVVGQGTSKNHLLIIKAAPKSRTKSGLHSQICVTVVK